MGQNLWAYACGGFDSSAQKRYVSVNRGIKSDTKNAQMDASAQPFTIATLVKNGYYNNAILDEVRYERVCRDSN